MTSNCPIIFGPLNKMLLIPFILALNQILYNIFILFFNYETSQIIESCSISFGHMLNAVIPHIFFNERSKIRENNKLEKMVYSLLNIRSNISRGINFIRSSCNVKYRFRFS